MTKIFLIPLIIALHACDVNLPNTCVREKEDVINFQHVKIIDHGKYACGKSKGYYCVRLCDD